jgi:hypothetical protein
VTKADAYVPALVPHLNRSNHLWIRLSVAWVEGMPSAQVTHQSALMRSLCLKRLSSGFQSVVKPLLNTSADE